MQDARRHKYCARPIDEKCTNLVNFIAYKRTYIHSDIFWIRDNDCSSITYMVWRTTFTALIGFSVSMFLDLNTVKLDVTWSALRANTGSCRRVLNTPASHTRGPGFKSQPEDQLSWLRVSWFSSVPPGKYRDSTLNWTTTAFYIPCNSSFNYRFIRYYIVWATKKVSSLLSD
jgi:hypothetical protein